MMRKTFFILMFLQVSLSSQMISIAGNTDKNNAANSVYSLSFAIVETDRKLDVEEPKNEIREECQDGKCRFKDIPLYGKVKVVEHFPDIKVKVVSSFPDLKVKKVTSFPDACGKWQFVDRNEDFTIKYVDHFPDITIKYVDHFPGLP